METTGPAIAREAVGPLRTLFFGPGRTLPPAHGLFFRYGVPLGVLALVGLAVANNQYLQDNREIDTWLSGFLSIGAVLPVAVAVRRPLVAWRIAYPLLFLGSMNASAKESWPWAPVQIIGFLAVLLLVAITSDSAVTAWAVAISIVPGFSYFGEPANAFGMAVLLVAVALLGDVFSRRRRSRVQLAEQTELTELERARRAVLEERARIAREMHDVVAHHMSMIAVQAETAPFRVPGLSEPARAELATIATSARSALTDMRRLLGVLRAESEDAPREPQPGLAELPSLIATARRAGVPVTFWTAGPDGIPDLFTPALAPLAAPTALASPTPAGPLSDAVSPAPPATTTSGAAASTSGSGSGDAARDAGATGSTVAGCSVGASPFGVGAFARVPEAIGLATYRIAQEALANAARHAPGGDVRVLVRALDDRLDLTVHNGPATPGSTPPPQNGSGHGLVGMRERAALLGGELTAGPDDRGGYRVTAVLPYPAASE